MTTKIESSKNQFYGMRIIVAVAVIVLLLVWLNWPPSPSETKPPQPKVGELIPDRERVPVSPELALEGDKPKCKVIKVDGGEVEVHKRGRFAGLAPCHKNGAPGAHSVP